VHHIFCIREVNIEIYASSPHSFAFFLHWTRNGGEISKQDGQQGCFGSFVNILKYIKKIFEFLKYF
jgi:hypothetical protein